MRVGWARFPAADEGARAGVGASGGCCARRALRSAPLSFAASVSKLARVASRQPIRLYPNLVRALVELLQTIFGDSRRQADKVIQQVLRAHRKWGARDRAFVAETAYEVVRWYRLLCVLAGLEPRHAHQWWQVLGTYWLWRGHELPPWAEFEGLSAKVVAARLREARSCRAVIESVPDWLDARGAAEWGEAWPRILRALNEPAPVVLRVNRLKVRPEQVAEALARGGVATRRIEACPDGLLVTERKHLFGTEAFRQGWFELQDAASQQVAPFLQVAPGMRVVDACAGAGGKTLHLAALMRNRGRIIAMDVHEWKLAELKRRARRAAVSIVEPRLLRNGKAIKRLRESADRLLLDVPCSGLGVLRRNPDAKWKRGPEFVEAVRQLQRDLLVRYCRMLRPGGLMVYATCSILPSENEAQVRWFLAHSPVPFALEAERMLRPDLFGFDGFYMARLRRCE